MVVAVVIAVAAMAAVITIAVVVAVAAAAAAEAEGRVSLVVGVQALLKVITAGRMASSYLSTASDQLPEA